MLKEKQRNIRENEGGDKYERIANKKSGDKKQLDDARNIEKI